MAEKRQRMTSHTNPHMNNLGTANSTSVLEVAETFLRKQAGCEALVNSWRLIMTDAEIQLCVDRVALHLNQKFRHSPKPVLLTAILKGVYVFLSDLTKRLTFNYSVYFLEASSYGHGQQQSEVKLLSQIDARKFVGRQVVLLDELFDNGTTLTGIRDLLLKNPDLQLTASDIFTCTLFTKRSGTNVRPPDLVGVADLPPLWLVGYGLDDQGEKRGWPHLFACPKLPGIPKEPEDDVFLEGPLGLGASFGMRKEIVGKLTTIQRELQSQSHGSFADLIFDSAH